MALAPGVRLDMSATFDVNQRFTRTGTITELDWRNPHISLSVDVRSEEGQVETWFYPPGRQRYLDAGRGRALAIARSRR